MSNVFIQSIYRIVYHPGKSLPNSLKYGEFDSNWLLSADLGPRKKSFWVYSFRFYLVRFLSTVSRLVYLQTIAFFPNTRPYRWINPKFCLNSNRPGTQRCQRLGSISPVWCAGTHTWWYTQTEKIKVNEVCSKQMPRGLLLYSFSHSFTSCSAFVTILFFP